MKVVTQLVRYFWERGSLTSLEIESLLRHGFVRASDLPGYKPQKRPPGPIIDPADLPPVHVEHSGPLELVEESLVRRTSVRRGPAGSKGKVLQIKEILVRLNAEYARRTHDLRSLHAFGCQYADCEDWYEAAIELRQQSPSQFYDGLCRNLASEKVLLGDLWQALDPEPLHRLIREDEVRGRAANAFLALLVADDSQELGRYAWVLKHDEMKAIINLRVVHEKLLACLGRMYQEDRPLLTAALRRNIDPIQFWALILIHNARREPTPDANPVFGKEYGPLELPSLDVWKQAWASALAMDRSAVTKLLIACYEGADEAEDVSKTPCGQGIVCPVGWHVP